MDIYMVLSTYYRYLPEVQIQVLEYLYCWLQKHASSGRRSNCGRLGYCCAEDV